MPQVPHALQLRIQIQFALILRYMYMSVQHTLCNYVILLNHHHHPLSYYFYLNVLVFQ